jgi:hypothetical protein
VSHRSEIRYQKFGIRARKRGSLRIAWNALFPPSNSFHACLKHRPWRVFRGHSVPGSEHALDENAVLTLVRRVRPDAVIEELTSLPKRYTPEEMRAAAHRDRTVRLVGGRNVHSAARAAGAKRYIVQSTGFFYGPGPGLAAEKDARECLSRSCKQRSNLHENRRASAGRTRFAGCRPTLRIFLWVRNLSRPSEWKRVRTGPRTGASGDWLGARGIFVRAR